MDSSDEKNSSDERFSSDDFLSSDEWSCPDSFFMADFGKNLCKLDSQTSGENSRTHLNFMEEFNVNNRIRSVVVRVWHQNQYELGFDRFMKNLLSLRFNE